MDHAYHTPEFDTRQPYVPPALPATGSESLIGAQTDIDEVDSQPAAGDVYADIDTSVVIGEDVAYAEEPSHVDDVSHLGSLASTHNITAPGDAIATHEENPDADRPAVNPGGPDDPLHPDSDTPPDERPETPPADGTDDTPPIDPPAAEATTSDGPERGAALYRICDYAVTTIDARTQADTDPALVEMQYGDDLEAVGLSMTSGEDDDGGTFIQLNITDPAAFAEAVAHMPVPEDHHHAVRVQETLIDGPVEEALNNTARILISVVRSGAAASGVDTEGMFAHSEEALPPSEGDIEFAATFITNAGTIADGLSRLRAGGESTSSDSAIETMRLLATAHEEDLTLEWAASYGLDLIGHLSPVGIGTYYLETPDAWRPVYSYCQYLARAAPNAAFTQGLRHALIRDIDAALQSGETLRGVRDENGELLPGAASTLFRQTARNLNYPNLLEEARDRILRIFASPGN